jgi:CspA family cold shock protein
MRTGTVKWYNDAKGYGFITPDDGGVDVFVHCTAAKGDGTLAEGSRVEFNVVAGTEGRVRAANVQAVNVVNDSAYRSE